jgi:hypothetical protein
MRLASRKAFITEKDLFTAAMAIHQPRREI